MRPLLLSLLILSGCYEPPCPERPADLPEDALWDVQDCGDYPLWSAP